MTPPSDRRFFHVEDASGIGYWIVACDPGAAREILRKHGVLFATAGGDEVLVDHPDVTSLPYTEIGFEEAMGVNTRDEDSTHYVAPLAIRPYGRFYSTEF